MKRFTKLLLVFSILGVCIVCNGNELKTLANEKGMLLENRLQKELDLRPITEITTISSVVYAPTVTFRFEEVRYINGMWQLRSSVLAPTHFDWSDNGIPLEVVTFRNGNGQIWDGSQTSFAFIKNKAYRTGNSGWNYGYFWHEYTYPGYGTWWMAQNY